MDTLERIAVALEGILASLQQVPQQPRVLKPRMAAVGEYCQAFEEWWGHYPVARRSGKKAAYKSWIAAGKHLKVAHPDWTNEKAATYLLVKLIQFAKSPKGMHPKFCPMPTTFLNQGRYDDDPAAWQNVDDGRFPRPEPERIPDYAA